MEKSNKEKALELESIYKQRCQKEFNEFKAGKRKSATIKVNYIYPFSELEQIYNERNDNEEPWFK